MTGSRHARDPCSQRCPIVALVVSLALVAASTLPAQDGERREDSPIRVRDYAAELAPTPAVEAVDRALVYLQSTQQPNGSWVSQIGANTGITSLCVMAFLARGHTPGRGPHKETIDRAIRWVIRQSRDGLIIRDTSHGPLYSHGISTMMLGEVLGMVPEGRDGFEDLSRVYLDAINVILRAQNVSKDRSSRGGWRYHPNSIDSDISCTGWQLLALRAAQGNGFPVPRRNIDGAVDYVKRCIHPLGGFGYQPGGDPTAARTGTGILSLQICGEFNSAEAFQGGDWLLKHPLEWRGPFFFYAVYYCSQGMYQLGGEYWRRWRPLVETLLVSRQRANGSWPTPPDETLELHAGPAYCTAMAALALSVDFKLLPIYQR